MLQLVAHLRLPHLQQLMLELHHLGFIANPKGKRAIYYMSIMMEVHSRMRTDRESDDSFKTRFVAESSRYYDFLLEKRVFIKGQIVVLRERGSF